MSNNKKYYVILTLYNVGFMFCTGAIMQTFLLQAGFTEKQVYIFNSFIQIVQTVMLGVMTFLSSKIRKVKLVTGLSYLSLVVLASVFLLGAAAPDILGKKYIIAVFIAAGVAYVGLGIYSVMAYCLPYYIMDMKDYGRVGTLASTIAGLCTFALSFLHTFIVARFNYMQATAWFFVLAIACFVLSTCVCLSLKERDTQTPQKTTSKDELLAVFKNKNTYILLLPNFTRGLAAGIMSVITVIAISTRLLNDATSAYVNIITQVSILASSFIYVVVCRKISTKNLLLIATLGICVLLPLCLQFGTVTFLILLCATFFFRQMSDAAIPILVTEIIPKEQIGAYTSIRMLVFTAAQAVATLIITPITSVIGYTGLLIFAAAMQLLCGAMYYAVALLNKKSNTAKTEA